jgi:hypothetical protein
MCRYLIVDSDSTGRLLGLVDAYGHCHLARVLTPAAPARGAQLHGPRAALGLHFLAVEPSGQRLNAHFEFIGASRQAMLDRLHGAPHVRPGVAADIAPAAVTH